MDAAGNVLLAGGGPAVAFSVIATQRDYRVRAVAARTGTFYGMKMTAGHIYTVTGTGFSGGGGPPLRGEITDPIGVSVDGRVTSP